MYAAVVKFNALSDTVRAAAKDHDLRLVGFDRVLVRCIVSGVIVGVVLCTADMDAFPGFLCAKLYPAVPDVILRDFQDLAEILV